MKGPAAPSQAAPATSGVPTWHSLNRPPSPRIKPYRRGQGCTWPRITPTVISSHESETDRKAQDQRNLSWNFAPGSQPGRKFRLCLQSARLAFHGREALTEHHEASGTYASRTGFRRWDDAYPPPAPCAGVGRVPLSSARPARFAWPMWLVGLCRRTSSNMRPFAKLLRNSVRCLVGGSLDAGHVVRLFQSSQVGVEGGCPVAAAQTQPLPLRG